MYPAVSLFVLFLYTIAFFLPDHKLLDSVSKRRKVNACSVRNRFRLFARDRISSLWLCLGFVTRCLLLPITPTPLHPPVRTAEPEYATI